MFTGLVEDTGTIVSRAPFGNGIRFAIKTRIDLAEVELGASIAVDGVCLTAESFEGDVWTATAGAETLAATTLGDFKAGRRVHLERALRLGDRLGGHLVQGHVDGVGAVRSIAKERESVVIWTEAPPELSRFIANKGSITLDGVSLTVNEIDGHAFRVGIVPHTAEWTHLGDLRPGSRVNLEVDVLAKYVERLLGARSDAASGVDLAFLQKHGFAT